jgi:hypothetical protein
MKNKIIVLFIVIFTSISVSVITASLFLDVSIYKLLNVLLNIALKGRQIC